MAILLIAAAVIMIRDGSNTFTNVGLCTLSASIVSALYTVLFLYLLGLLIVRRYRYWLSPEKAKS